MKIGSLQLDNNVILAPMAGISNLPYRQLMKRCGAGLVFTEMVSANGLIRDGRKTFELLESCPEEQPLGIQLFGDDPAVLAAGADMLAVISGIFSAPDIEQAVRAFPLFR